MLSFCIVSLGLGKGWLYTLHFFMTLRFLYLAFSFLLTRYLCIDKNYTLSIFMLSGIYHKIMPFLSSILMLSLSHALTFQIIDHIKYASSHAFKSFTIQFMRFKHTLLKTCLVHKIPFTLIKFVISLCLYNSHS